MILAGRCRSSGNAWPQLLALASAGAETQQTRGMKLFELFSKEKREERRRKIMDELNRGYFDDFKDFREKQGKVFFGPERLVPATRAAPFPAIEPLLSDGTKATFPPTPAGTGAPAVSLVCVALRAGADRMLAAWAVPFSLRFQQEPGAALYDLALIESKVMALWPFRGMLLREAVSSQGRYAMPTTHLLQFGNVEPLQSALQMSNRLTGYVYLLDSAGRVRWRGSGKPDAQELQLLLKCSEDLLNEARQDALQV